MAINSASSFQKIFIPILLAITIDITNPIMDPTVNDRAAPAFPYTGTSTKYSKTRGKFVPRPITKTCR